MMKKYFFILGLLIGALSASARHVAGGELMYEYLGPTADNLSSNYKITLRLFRDSLSTGPLLSAERVYVGFYVNGARVAVISNGVSSNDLFLPLTGTVTQISLNTSSFPCLVGDVSVAYQLAYYSAVVTLPNNREGYTLSTLGCCRVDGISNLNAPVGANGSASIGNNYVTYIPGSRDLPNGEHNSSPKFNLRDTALVCASKKFRLDFGATDADGDSLTFSFCEAFTSGVSGTGIRPSDQLTMIPLPYLAPYGGGAPLGTEVAIHPGTGIISGIAPPEGKYVVNVCITEWRNGRPFSQHRKDFLLKVQSCDIIEADLPDRIVQCRDSIVHFENGSLSSGVTSYLWEFGDKKGSSSSEPTVDFPYADTGRYMARLTVHGPQGCVGTDSTEVLVYPGFKPAFDITGSCYFKPYLFGDATVSKYGVPNQWRWDFGDLSTLADTARTKNASYTYASAATRQIRLVVSDTKGCIDSLQKDVVIRDKPLLNLPFKDTLICAIDTLAIPVTGTGNYSWLPNYNILYANTKNPLVFPKDTTRYIVSVDDQGCVNSDTVTVNVLPFITVQLGSDSLICAGDAIQLRPVSHALQYRWTSSTGEPVNPVKYPTVQPLSATKYYVTANLGKCQDRDSVQIRTVPYPRVTVSPDTAICTGARAQLRAVTTAAFINWSPAASLSGGNTRFPVAGPPRTTMYIATVRDTLGCPKTTSDTVTVTVAPPVKAFAGHDTTAVAGQPLQLQAEGGVSYLWTPELYLSNIGIANPVAGFPVGVDSVRYYVRVMDQYGCWGDDDVLVRVYRTAPEIFVPSAFTPNGDGLNDVLRPVTAGIARLQFFSVYNRYGQVLFTTSEIGKGWDGQFNGYPQPSGTYVYQAQGTDYTGKAVFRKGTVVLIR